MGILDSTPGYGSRPQAPRGSGPTTSGKPSDPYWGTNPARNNLRTEGPRRNLGEGNLGGWYRGTPASDYLSLPDGLKVLEGIESRQGLWNLLRGYGLVGKNTNWASGSVDTVWKKAMNLSAQEYANGKKLTPWQILEMMAKSGGGGGRGSGGSRGGGGGGPATFTGTKTTTSIDTVLSDRKTAKAMVEAVLQDKLGRDPSKNELNTFIRALWDAEEKNPVKTTTSTKYVQSEAKSSKSKRSGGLDQPGKMEVLEEKVQESPALKLEREAQQEAKYFDAIMQMSGGGQ